MPQRVLRSRYLLGRHLLLPDTKQCTAYKHPAALRSTLADASADSAAAVEPV